MFRHRGAILRESFRLKEYKTNTLMLVCTALIGMIEIPKYIKLIGINFNFVILKLCGSCSRYKFRSELVPGAAITEF